MRLKEKQIEEIKGLKSKGLSEMQIALKLGISFWTIRYHINDNYREAIKKSNKKRWDKKKENE